jgi:hypothetical protein
MSQKIRIKYASLAEKEINRYKDDLVLWFKHICNFELRAPQAVWVEEILENDFVLMVAQPRLGKTMLMEMVDLFECATTPLEDGRTWAPNVSQAQDSYNYQFQAIQNSEVLKAYLAWEKGKEQLSSVRYKFINQSNWRIFGIQSEFEGVNATIIRAEEFDDLDIVRFEDRVLQRGAAKNKNGKPTRVRLSGTIQEAKGNMYQYETSGSYHVCAKFPFNTLLKMGYYDEKIVAKALENLTDEAVQRIFHLKYVAGRNFIWEDKLLECHANAKAKNWVGIEYLPGGRYSPMGHVFAGFDCGHSGSLDSASVWSFQVWEAIGDTVLWLNGFNWVPTENTITLIDDVVAYWYHYRIQKAYGDALKSDLIALINDRLYNERLIAVDRQRFPENSAGNWDKWDFSPQWNTGRFKYLAGGILKNKIDRRKALIPKFDAKDDRKIAVAGKLLASRLTNVREVKGQGAYPKLEAINGKLGDDDFDSSCMAMQCINDHGPAQVDLSMIQTSGRGTEYGGGMERGIGSQIKTERVFVG